MKSRLLGAALCVGVLALAAGCGARGKEMYQPDTSVLDSQKDRPVFFCWFVEDNGAGGSGYIALSESQGRPLLPDEPLYHTLDELRHVLKNKERNHPIVIPKHPDWVPEHWKVRDLSANEAAQFGDAARNRQ